MILLNSDTINAIATASAAANAAATPVINPVEIAVHAVIIGAGIGAGWVAGKYVAEKATIAIDYTAEEAAKGAKALYNKFA